MGDERFSRQARFAPLGEDGQARLSRATVLIVGVGATGSALAEGLARAGVGALRLVDRDLVELSNLGRQALYGEGDIGYPKALAARERLLAINSMLAIDARAADAGPRQLAALAAGADLILDGTDNFSTRMLINATAVRLNIPWIYTGAIGATAVSLPIIPGETACLACLYPQPPAREERCETAGVLHAAVLQAAALSLTEAIKILGGRSQALRRELWQVDLWQGEIGRVRAAPPRPDCAICQGRDFSILDTPQQGLRVTRLCAGAVQVAPPEGRPPLDLAALAVHRPGAAMKAGALHFDAEGATVTLFADGRAILESLPDPARAEAIYRRLLE
jgi:adenylyltransferase/sulfurtransferase